MSRSSKLGAVSLVFFALIFISAGLIRHPDLPVLLCAWFSILFGLLAVKGGSKWWLAVPCFVAALVAVAFYFGIQAT
jgi:hypothetical protein